MKKNLVLTTLLVLVLFSCSKESIYDDSSLSHENNEPIIINNLDDFSKLLNIDSIPYNTRSFWSVLPPNWKNMQAAEKFSLQEKTVKGYDRIIKGSTKRTMFTSSVAKILGLYTNRIYHIHVRKIEKDVNIPFGYEAFEDNSPLCGYLLANTGETNFTHRGYIVDSKVNNGNITLTTYTYFVEKDEWAGKINREYPCNTSELVWNYVIAK